jgi:hypothetical protein
MAEHPFGFPPCSIPPNWRGLSDFHSDFYSGTLTELPQGVRGIFRASRGWTIQVPLRLVPSLPGFVKPPPQGFVIPCRDCISAQGPFTYEALCLLAHANLRIEGGELCRSAAGLSQAMAVPRSPVVPDIPA